MNDQPILHLNIGNVNDVSGFVRKLKSNWEGATTITEGFLRDNHGWKKPFADRIINATHLIIVIDVLDYINVSLIGSLKSIVGGDMRDINGTYLRNKRLILLWKESVGVPDNWIHRAVSTINYIVRVNKTCLLMIAVVNCTNLHKLNKV